MSDVLLHYRAIWISDIHLGTTGCRAVELLEFLKHTESQYLYLVGDIVDGWQLRKRWYWPQSHNDVIQKVLRKARKGTQVVYIPGNHDEMARQFSGLALGDIKITEQTEHTTLKGMRLLITHGDFFDGVVQCAPWLAHIGDAAYTMILRWNHWLNKARASLGLPYWSLSQYLKHKVKNAVSYISSFEEALAKEAHKQGYQGVVCGHIHKAEITQINGITYCNDGDWVESLSALVETDAGDLEIITWQEVMQRVSKPVAPL